MRILGSTFAPFPPPEVSPTIHALRCANDCVNCRHSDSICACVAGKAHASIPNDRTNAWRSVQGSSVSVGAGAHVRLAGTPRGRVRQAALAQCCPQAVLELSKDCSRLVQELFQSCSKVVPKLFQGSPCGDATRPCALRGRNCSEDVTELLQSRSKAVPRVVLGLFQNCSKVGPKLFQGSPCGDATRP